MEEVHGALESTGWIYCCGYSCYQSPSSSDKVAFTSVTVLEWSLFFADDTSGSWWLVATSSNERLHDIQFEANDSVIQGESPPPVPMPGLSVQEGTGEGVFNKC